MREAWVGGQGVPELRAGEAVVVKRAPVHLQDGTALPRRGVSIWSSRNAAIFLRLQMDYDIGSGKALRSGLRNCELQATTESFGAVDGARGWPSPKTSDLVRNVTINQI